MDHSKEHDPTDTYSLEQDLSIEEVEFGTDTSEVQDAEDAAMNTDNETARDATKNTEVLEREHALVEEIKELDEELKQDDKKKGRQSTSEKAKLAAAKREEKTGSAAPISKTVLDPLRARGKKYREMVKLVDRSKQYEASEALDLAKKTSFTKFDAAIEFHANVKGENVRGTVILPSGNGKTRRVAIADDAILEKIAAGNLDFDILLATPAMMPKLARFAKVLGPKGLMPSPKTGTVTETPDAVIAEINGGRVEFRADKTGVVHLSIGKASFATEKLLANLHAVQSALSNAKVQSMSISSTMGPGIKLAA